jgi:peptidoglycan hydrolase-like protein with peptidoglycan-binding domain
MSEELITDTDFGSQIEDVEAIDRYMRTTFIDPSNSEAFQIKDAYMRWYDKAAWGTRENSAAFYDEQRTRRNQFNIALQRTEADKQKIRDVIARGIETEEMQGKKRPPVDPQTGRVGTQVKKPTVAPTPSTMPKGNQPLGPVEVVPGKIYPTIRRGSKLPEVKVWQSVIGVTADGNFGPATEAATKKWQASHGLVADGIVGPKSWAAAGTAPAPDFIPGPSPTFAPSTPAAKVTFAPKEKPAPEFKPEPKAPTPVEKKVKETATAVKAQVTKAAVTTAGALDVGTWPMWAKVLGGLTVAGGILATALGKGPKRFL